MVAKEAQFEGRYYVNRSIPRTSIEVQRGESMTAECFIRESGMLEEAYLTSRDPKLGVGKPKVEDPTSEGLKSETFTAPSVEYKPFDVKAILEIAHDPNFVVKQKAGLRESRI